MPMVNIIKKRMSTLKKVFWVLSFTWNILYFQILGKQILIKLALSKWFSEVRDIKVFSEPYDIEAAPIFQCYTL